MLTDEQIRTVFTEHTSNTGRQPWWRPFARAIETEVLKGAPAWHDAPWLLIVHGEQQEPATLVPCTDVMEAVKQSMFFLQPGEELDAEHMDELRGVVGVLMESGWMRFEGDPPLQLVRTGPTSTTKNEPAWQDAPTGPGRWIDDRDYLSSHVDAAMPLWAKPGLRWFGPIPADGSKT